MGLACFVVLLSLVINEAVGHPGDPVMYLPPFEVRTLDGAGRVFPFSNHLQPMSPRVLPQQHVFHTTPAPVTTPPPPPPEEKTEKPHNHHNFTVTEFLDVLNDMADNSDDRFESRAVERDPDSEHGYNQPPPPPPYPPYQSYPPYQRPSYGPPRYPAYGSYSPPPPPYHEPPASAYPPAPVQHEKKVELSGILKPVTTKVASKVSGLVGLVLALLTGSVPEGLHLKGFKDIVINGIIKPLLIAKGGIKSLISKLAIPVIVLLLINVEVLITIWWLWEECPQPTYSYSKPTYSYSKPSYPSPYNSY